MHALKPGARKVGVTVQPSISTAAKTLIIHINHRVNDFSPFNSNNTLKIAENITTIFQIASMPVSLFIKQQRL